MPSFETKRYEDNSGSDKEKIDTNIDSLLIKMKYGLKPSDLKPAIYTLTESIPLNIPDSEEATTYLNYIRDLLNDFKDLNDKEILVKRSLQEKIDREIRLLGDKAA